MTSSGRPPWTSAAATGPASRRAREPAAAPSSPWPTGSWPPCCTTASACPRSPSPPCSASGPRPSTSASATSASSWSKPDKSSIQPRNASPPLMISATWQDLQASIIRGKLKTACYFSASPNLPALALTLLREQAGLTVRQVADKVGAWSTHSTIGDWCAGRSLPSLASRDLFLQVIQACGVSDAELFEQWHQAWLRVRRAPGRPAGNQEPYRGLASCQAEDADWFFGRQALTAELIARLTGLDQVSGGTQLVIGPSGSGKSSLL